MIKLFAMDVDGTLTDGGVYMDGRGGEWKRFDIQDGMGIARLKASGVVMAFVSGRPSPATDQRAKDLGVDRVYNGASDKLSVLRELAFELGLSREEVAYMGDDVNDLPAMEWAGLGIAPANALPEVKAASDWVTNSCGGHGAVREAAERILELNASGAKGESSH